MENGGPAVPLPEATDAGEAPGPAPADDASVRKSALFVAVLASFLTPFAASSVNVALPTIGTEFHMDAVLLSWVSTGFLLASASTLVPFGRLADLHGRKRLFLYGMLVWTAFSLLCAFMPTGNALIAMRFGQGVGGGMIFGTSVAILTSVYPPSERGRVLGISVAAVYLGMSVGPFVGGLITATLGWRAIFLLNVPLGLVVVAVTTSKLRGEWAGARGERFDLPGAVIYMVMVMSVVVGFAILPGWDGLALLLAGLAILAVFIALERRTPSPVLDIRMFSGNRVFAFSNMATLINYAATFAIGFFMSLYLQNIRGLSPEMAGLVLLSQPIVQAVFSPAAGRLSDRVEPRVVASVGMALTFLGLLYLSSLQEGTPMALVVGALALLGLGFALFSSPNTNAIMGSVRRSNYGLASSMVSTMRGIGQTLSMGVASMLLGVYVGAHEVTRTAFHPEFMASFHVGFAVFSVLCLVGIFASLVRGNLRGPDGNGE